MNQTRSGAGILALIAAVAIILVLYMGIMQQNTTENSQTGQKEIKTLQKSKKVADQAKLRGLQDAISSFQIEKGRYPKNLEELVEANYVTGAQIKDHNGKKFQYQNGRVSANQ